MRILTMADTPADPNRGAAGTEVRTIEALRLLGHDVDSLWANRLGRRIQHGNLHLLLELPRAYERAAVRALRSRSYDVVHVNQPHGFRAARAVHRIAPNTVFVHRSHGLELHVEETLAKWRILFEGEERSRSRAAASSLLASLLARHSHAVAREADGHVVSSTLDADFLAHRMNVDRRRIAVVAQAAPDAYVRASAPTMASDRLRRALYVGQFSFVKAPMILAKAIDRLDVRMTWVCDRTHHTAIRALLTARANERVDLVHWMPQDELRSVYDAHGLFLFPSFFEGFGKAFVEAMSRGCVVVASDVGGMRDLILHGENGLLVPAGDAEALADAARTVMGDPGRARAMSTAAARTAREHTWDRVARELVHFYERLRGLARNA